MIVDYEKEMRMVGNLLTDEQKRRAVVIQALHKIQKEHNYLPAEQLEQLSRELNLPLSEIYSTASFYKQLHFNPRGKNIVCVCVGTACHVRGSGEVVKRLEDSLGVKVGETTPDMSVTLETVGCVGCCGLAPVVVVNDVISGEVGPQKVADIVESVKNGGPSEE